MFKNDKDTVEKICKIDARMEALEKQFEVVKGEMQNQFEVVKIKLEAKTVAQDKEISYIKKNIAKLKLEIKAFKDKLFLWLWVGTSWKNAIIFIIGITFFIFWFDLLYSTEGVRAWLVAHGLGFVVKILIAS